MNRFSLIYMKSRLESYLFTYTTTNIVQEIIKQTSIQVQIFITMNLNMNNNNNNNVQFVRHYDYSRLSFFVCLKPLRASNQCRASNRQTRASNNHNALQMNVIVILTSKNNDAILYMSCSWMCLLTFCWCLPV